MGRAIRVMHMALLASVSALSLPEKGLFIGLRSLRKQSYWSLGTET